MTVIRQRVDGLTCYTFDGPGAGLRHALITRLGGVSTGHVASLNLGSTVGDDPAAVQENLRRVCTAFDLQRDRLVSPHQVHGCHVVRVGAADGGRIIPAADALMTDEPGVALLLRFADCAPVLFHDPVRQVTALAHAGWRGAAAGVVPATVAALGATFGSRPGDLWAGIGPAIGPEQYAVGPEVVTAIAAACPPGALIAAQRAGEWYLDLPGALAAQLRAAGVEQIALSHLCTASHTDEWYSHRAEQGKTGRFGVFVMLE